MSRLDRATDQVQLGDCVIRALGISGEVEVASADNSRGEKLPPLPQWIHQAVSAEQVEHAGAIVMRDLEVSDPDRDAPAVEIELPELTENYGRVLLSEDEGVYTWVIDNSVHDDPGPEHRGGGTRSYTVPVITERGERAQKGGKRGTIARVVDKVVHVLEFAFRKPIGDAARQLATQWETTHRPYRLRSFGPEDYRLGIPSTPDVSDLTHYTKGPILLFIHGTFSSAAASFCEIDEGAFRELYRRYDGRVLAFDHPTLAADPAENVKEFLLRFANTRIDLDIVCHSRGGLVARDLAAAGSGARVRRIVFVGSPNVGTALTQPEHMVDFISTYTNSLGMVVETVGGPVVAHVADVMEAVVHSVKHIAGSALRGLPGLQAMNPTGEYLKGAGTRVLDKVECFGIGSDYTPARLQLKAWVADLVMDRVFSHAANDLVVPFAGTFQVGVALKEKLEFGHEDAVHHCAYFGRREVGERLVKWLV